MNLDSRTECCLGADPHGARRILIRQTARGVRIEAVGRVTTRGQQDFHRVTPAPIYIADDEEAITAE